MSASPLSKYSPQQLLTWASIIALFLLLGIRYLVFSGDLAADSFRQPHAVRTCRDNLNSLVEVRLAAARRGPVDFAAIPDREYTVVNIDPSVADEDAPYPAGEGEELLTAPPVVAPPVPTLRGIVQSRDMGGNITLRACYPRVSVLEGESVEGYRVARITSEQVTLVKDGRELVQRIRDERLSRIR